jgi:glycosyltransferase domain-containing protein
MADLSELTIIVPSYNRHAFVVRQVDFWCDKGVTLHVLDGSALALETRERFDAFPTMHYHHMPQSIYSRLVSSIDLISTPYAVFLGDDEFYIPSALVACIRAIREDELVACCGLALAFHHEEGNVYTRQRYPEMRGLNNNSADARSRIMKSIDRALPSVIYAVHRSDVFKNNLEMFRDYDSSCAGTFEVQFTLMTCLQGRTKVMDELSWLRSCENASVATAKWDARYGLEKWISDPDMKEDIDEFYEVMLKLCTERFPEYNPLTVRSWLEEAVDAYATFKLQRKKHMKKGSVITNLGNRFSSYLPSFLIDALKPAHNGLMRRLGYDHHKEFKPLLEIATELSNDGITVDFDALQEIDKTICDYYAKRDAS